jgi:ribosomal protein L11 methyltransferase
MAAKWQQIHIPCPKNLSDALEDCLMGLGSLAITYQDLTDSPIFEPKPGETPLWDINLISALFTIDVEMQLVTQVVLNTFPSFKHSDLNTETVPDEAWETKWMDNFKPIHCGGSLWICPTWLEPPEPTATNLMLDPGLAFGTGTHPTTQLCLQWLAKQHLGQQSFMDFGCGSGILGIAALLLGAGSGTFVDIDPQAEMATLANAKTNQTDKHIHVCHPDQLDADLEVDFLMANILQSTLIELVEAIQKLVKPEGKIVLSGILIGQEAAVIDCYAPFFEHFDVQTQEDWVSLSAVKKP